MIAKFYITKSRKIGIPRVLISIKEMITTKILNNNIVKVEK